MGMSAEEVQVWHELCWLCPRTQLLTPLVQILPVPSFNIINGGSHAGNALAMQVSCPTQ